MGAIAMAETLFRLLPLTAAILPGLILLCYFAVTTRSSLSDDIMWRAVGLGACSVFPCLLVALFLSMVVDVDFGFYGQSAKSAFVEAAIPEELGKLVALLCLCWSRLDKMTARQIFLYSIACACGFAVLENLFYIFGNESNEQALNPEWASTAMMRSVSAVPGHVFVGAVMGYCVYHAAQPADQTADGGWFWWVSALFYPILLHGGYDFFLFAGEALSQSKLGDAEGRILMMTTGFIFVVIAEGTIAHLLLRKVMRLEATQPAAIPSHDLTSRLGYHFLPWILLGCCTLGGAAFFLFVGVAISSDLVQTLMVGFAIFALLHGLVFLFLARRLYRNPGLVMA